MITYCEISSVDAEAKLQEAQTWTDLGDQEKQRLVDHATKDLEITHGQPRNQTIPWRLGEPELVTSAVEQCLWLSQTIENRKLEENLRATTQGQYDDGNIKINPGSGAIMGEYAQKLLEDYMMRVGVNPGAQFQVG